MNIILFVRHKEVKVDYKVWRCDQCSRPFVCRELLELHSKKFHKVKNSFQLYTE